MTDARRRPAPRPRGSLLARPGQTILTAVAIFAAATALVVTLSLRAGLDDPFADALDRDARRARRASTATSATRTSPTLTAPARRRRPPTPARRRPRARRSTARRTRSGSKRSRRRTRPSIDRSVTDGRRPGHRGRGARRAQLRARGGPHAWVTGSTLGTVAGLAVTTEQATLPALGPGPRLGRGRHRRRPPRRASASRPRGHRRVQAAAARRALPGTRLAFDRLARGARHDHRPDAHERARDQRSTRCSRCSSVGFTVATVISGRVLAQRREIGLLKAVGFTPRGIVALLVGEYLAIGAGRRACSG